MRTVLVLVIVVLVAPGPGRPESQPGGWATPSPALEAGNATRGLHGLDSGNPFWDRLHEDCGKRTSLRCVQKSVFRFLKKSLGEKDVIVTDSLVFKRNHNAFSPHPLAAVSAMLLEKKDDSADTDDGNMDLHLNTMPTVEDLTDDLYDQGMSFIKSHDVLLRLPSMLGGSEVRLSPRAFEDDGATFKISFSRPHVDPEDSSMALTRSSRMFFGGKQGIIKKITRE